MNLSGIQKLKFREKNIFEGHDDHGHGHKEKKHDDHGHGHKEKKHDDHAHKKASMMITDMTNMLTVNMIHMFGQIQ